MFFRKKKSGSRIYLQVVENRWEEGRSKQRVIATLGRLDQLRQSGQLEGLLRSGAKFCESVALLAAHRRGETTTVHTRPIGPAMVFERLWQETGCKQVIGRLLQDRKFTFPIERALFLTVLHRLFPSGSDRAAQKWKETIELGGTEKLGLHHLYRAMAWLGEALDPEQQFGATPFAPRCTKDLISAPALAVYPRCADAQATGGVCRGACSGGPVSNGPSRADEAQRPVAAKGEERRRPGAAVRGLSE